MLTLEQIFHKSYLAIMKQGAPSFQMSGDTLVCLYRHTDLETGRVTACGVGHLYPDSHHHLDFDSGDDGDDGQSAQTLLCSNADFRVALRAGGIDPETEGLDRLLAQLQVAHDAAARETKDCCGAFLGIYNVKMTKLAERREFTLPAIPT